MKDIVTALTEKFRRERRNAHRYVALLLALSMVTTLFVNWQLHGDGIAKTADYQCGLEEHTHTADCYPKVLVCGYEEGEPEDWTVSQPDADTITDDSFGADPEPEVALQSAEPEYIWVPHEHTADCYQEVTTEVPVLTCFEEEHVHTDDCFDPEDGSLICDQFEHTHDDSCYTIEYETEEQLVCGLEEGELVEELNPDYNPVAMFEAPVAAARPVVVAPVAEGPVHHHTDACYAPDYTADPICGLKEHHHTVNCLSDPLDGLEDESDWLDKTGTALTGMWNEDLLTVAQGQLGYEQSEKNFKLDTDDGVTVRHYSRYGQWYGNPYGAWDVMFLSYCLNYAGVPQTVVPQRAGTQALRSDLRGSDWLKDTADVQQILPGDIVFYDAATTETVTAPEQPTVSDDSPDADIALLSMDSAGTEAPQTEERTVTAETVGIVSDADEAGNLTVISGNVDGKVAEVSLTSADVTGVIDLTAAYEAKLEEDEAKPDAPAETPVETPADGGFSISVDHVDELPEGAKSALAAYAQIEEEIDLNRYITAAVFSKLVGKDWTPIKDGDTFADGEGVQIELTYKMPAGIVSATQNKLAYQLPNGLTLNEAKEDGVIYQGKKGVGSYTISKSGLVEMTFTDPTILSGAAFEGHFTFEAKVGYWSSDEEGKISFNDKFNLQLKKPDPDIAVTKGLDNQYAASNNSNFEGEDGNYYLRWYVKASTENGTQGKTVRIGDLLNGDGSGSFVESGKAQVLGSYVEDSVKVFKLAANGSKTQVDANQYKLTISNDGSLQRSLLVEDLPELAHGESYLLCYTTKVTPEEMNKCADRDGRIYNKGLAGMKDGPDVVTDKAEYISFNKRLSKDGKLNDDGTISWTITLNAPHKACKTFLRGYTVKDLFPKGVDVTGDVTVKADGNIVANITADELAKGYQIPEGSNATSYTFTFTTKAPNTNGTLTNKATAEKGGASFSAEKTFDFDSGSWSLSKTHVATANNIASWKLVATNTLGGMNFRLVDVMDALYANGSRIPDDSATPPTHHWFLKSELEAAVAESLQLTLRSGEVKSYAEVEDHVKIECFSDYAAKTPVTDDTVKARAFIITVNDLAVRRMELTVKTHEDRENVAVGENRKYRNAAYLNDLSVISRVTDEYTRYDAFKKEVSTDSRKTYTQNSTVEYKNVSGKCLRYRITLGTDADETKDIVITDTLPANTEYNKNQTELYLDGKEISSKDGRWSAEYDEASNLLTIRLSEYNPDQKTHSVEIQYEVNISGDPNWNDLAVTEVPYNNTAKWEDESSSTSTTVTRELTEVKKTGEQIMDDKDRPTNRVLYTVYLNPSAKTLNGGARLTVEDRLKLVAGADAYGDLSTVKFYHYEFVNGKPGIGAELPEGQCIILPSTADSWLRAEIPDSTAIVMQYECEIDPGTSTQPQLSNEVWLNGKKKDSAKNEVKHDSSSSKVSMGQLMLNKSDSYTGNLLKNAVFAFESYDQSTKQWKLWDTRTTNDAGQILLGVTPSGDDDTLKANTLYRIRETKAPDNYETDGTPRYVLFALNSEGFDSAYQAATGTTSDLTVDGVTIRKDTDIIQGSDTTTTILNVTNTYNQLTVIKSWLDSETKRETEAPVDEIRVQLYRTAKDGSNKTAVGDPVALNRDNKWSYTWAGNEIPSVVNGVACYYHVEELDEGNWRLESGNNDGIQTGKIYLWNYVYTGYELPSTGGSGTAPFAAAGGALMALALAGGAALTLKKRKTH